MHNSSREFSVTEDSEKSRRAADITRMSLIMANLQNADSDPSCAPKIAGNLFERIKRLTKFEDPPEEAESEDDETSEIDDSEASETEDEKVSITTHAQNLAQNGNIDREDEDENEEDEDEDGEEWNEQDKGESLLAGCNCKEQRCERCLAIGLHAALNDEQSDDLPESCSNNEAD